MNISSLARLSARHFPLASPPVARRQGIKLALAKRYLEQHGIDAVQVGSKFEYKAPKASHAATSST